MTTPESQRPPSDKEIFVEALERSTANERAAYLEAACGQDRSLRRRVEELLAHHFAQDSFMADPALDVETAMGQELPIAEGPGSRIGRYKLLQKIGEGGMGVVYMAEQDEPVRRRVALKIIKLGMDTKQVVARFEAERQALAPMDHPNIAKVLDAGATDSGRPFFVMDLIQGVPITEFCDKNRLSATERIKLFVPVCQAIQSAHQKGIIHRDIKPSNVLITLNAGAPVPKVIDFGVAKATNQKLTEKTLFTNYATMIGTPAYMSPEQAEMSSLDVDTRTDIYSLGVLLYELLTGSTPFPEKRLRSVSYNEMQRIIAEEEPERPSTRLSTLKDEQRRLVARNRGTSELGLGMAFASDLDWIVMKCLEKDRARRYETANGLAMDIQRFLGNEPIVARPPSQLYRVQKFARRNKVVFTAATAVILALITGLSLAIAGFTQARTQRDQALAARKTADQERAKALESERKARAEELLARQRAYTSAMSVVQQAWNDGNLKRAQDLLRSYVPKPGESDLRGFEWRYLWRLCQDESHRTFTNFPGAVRMVLSPDGRIAAAAGGSVVRLLDYASGGELDSLPVTSTSDDISALAFSPASTNVLATAAGKKFNLWNLAERRVTATATLSSSAVAVAISPDGKLFAVASGHEKTVALWSVESSSMMWQRETPTPVFALVFGPDGRSLLCGGGELCNPVLYDLTTGQTSSFPAPREGWINIMSLSFDGRVMATGSTDSTVILWDLAQRKVLDRLIMPGASAVECTAFSRDGRWLAVGYDDSTIRLWEVATRQLKAVYRGHQAGVNGVGFSVDGRYLLSSSWDGTIKVWDREPDSHGEILTQSDAAILTSDFSPDGRRLATIDWTGGLKIWDVAQRRLFEQRTQPPVSSVAAFSPKGDILAQAIDQRIKLWDAKTYQLRAELTNGFDAISLSFSPNGQMLAAAGLTSFILEGITNRLAFWDLTTKRKITKLAAAAPFAVIVSFSHDGRRVAIGYLDGQVRLWDFQTEQLVAEFTDQHTRIWAVAFSPDDTWLVAGGFDGIVVFYDVRARRSFRSGPPTSTWIAGLCFTPDGKTLASGEGNGTINLWNVATREIALTLRGHVGWLTVGTCFSPEGNLLASAASDGTVRFWPAPPLDQIR